MYSILTFSSDSSATVDEFPADTPPLVSSLPEPWMAARYRSARELFLPGILVYRRAALLSASVCLKIILDEKFTACLVLVFGK